MARGVLDSKRSGFRIMMLRARLTVLKPEEVSDVLKEKSLQTPHNSAVPSVRVSICHVFVAGDPRQLSHWDRPGDGTEIA
jgi:hypothetical protein